jgi:hypothetical protein
MTGKKTSSGRKTQREAGASVGKRPAIPLERIAVRAHEKWLKSGCKRGCDRQFWSEAKAELFAEMAGAKSSAALVELMEYLDDKDPEAREVAVGKLAFYGAEGIAALVFALNDESASVRATARLAFLSILPHDSLPSSLLQTLDAARAEDRLEGIREIVRVVPEVRNAIEAHSVGWDMLARLLSSSETVTEDSMQKVKEPRQISAPPPMLSPLPDWKPNLNSYREKQLLRFSSKKELHATIDLLWTEPFRSLPHCTPDGRSIVVPAEAVEHLARAGAKFTATRLRSISDLTPDEIRKTRR